MASSHLSPDIDGFEFVVPDGDEGDVLEEDWFMINVEDDEGEEKNDHKLPDSSRLEVSNIIEDNFVPCYFAPVPEAVVELNQNATKSCDVLPPGGEEAPDVLDAPGDPTWQVVLGSSEEHLQVEQNEDDSCPMLWCSNEYWEYVSQEEEFLLNDIVRSLAEEDNLMDVYVTAKKGLPAKMDVFGNRPRKKHRKRKYHPKYYNYTTTTFDPY